MVSGAWETLVSPLHVLMLSPFLISPRPGCREVHVIHLHRRNRRIDGSAELGKCTSLGQVGRQDYPTAPGRFDVWVGPHQEATTL